MHVPASLSFSVLRRSWVVAALALLPACGGSGTSADRGRPDAGEDLGADLGNDAVTDDAVGDGSTDGGDGPDGPTKRACEYPLPPALDKGTWDRQLAIAGVSGHDGLVPSVLDLVQDGGGAVLAVGHFQWLGRERVAPLLRLEGTSWRPARSSFELDVPLSGFSAVASGPGGELALATYDAGPGFERRGELWVDRGEGLTVVGRYNGLVRKLAWLDGDLWVAGNFQLDEGGPAGLAVWDGAGFSPPPGGAVDGPVYELVAGNGTLLVGGRFTTVGGVPADSVAEWNGKSWTAFDLGLDGLGVYALARDEKGELYAGGAFFVTPEDGVGGVARWTGTAWELLGGGVANSLFPGVVSDVAVHAGDVYVAGCFNALGAQSGDDASVPVLGGAVARYTAGGWEPLDVGAGVGSVWFNPRACGDEGPDAIWEVTYQRLLSDGKRLFIAGSFAGVGGVPSQSLIAFDGQSWQPQGAPERGLAGTVTSLALGGPDCALHALGPTHAGGTPLPSRLARYGQDGWTPVGPELPDGHVCERLAVSPEGTVYLGCYVETPDFELEPRVLRLDGDAWSEAFTTRLPGTLGDIAFDPEGRLWVVGGGATGFVGRLDGDELTVVEDGFDGPVLRISFHPASTAADTRLVVGGVFTRVGSKEVNRIAHYDGKRWTALGEGSGNTVIAVEYGRSAIYASATDEGAPNRPILARWDGSAWEELGTPARGLAAPMGKSTHTFTALAERGGQLVAVGYVWPEEGGRNVFVFDGERFTAIGGGVAAISVDAVAIAADGLWLGGSIAEAGPPDGLVATVGVARFTWSAK